jgi:glyoxylase-like metal-dependent hydrolase (beta-lactamase superfamily II)
MCDVTRRDFLAGGTALLAMISGDEIRPASAAEVGKVDNVSTDVYFHEDNQGCNTGWVILEDYVLVIDANYPSGAKEILPKIRALTDKPIRFSFDTHHHGDHVYGNQILVDNGAVPVAHTGVIEELKKYETGYYGGQPGRWEDTAKQRPDVKASRLKPPSVLFPRELFFDDGKHRVELIHLGVAHTHGDAFAWLPKESILFSGDACVNGPYNYVADGNVEQWVKTLDTARKLGAQIVCPGHGPRGTVDLLGDQQAYFQALRDQIGKLVGAKKSPGDIQKAVEQIRAELSADARIARYVSKGGLAGQVEKVLTEMTGAGFPAAQRPGEEARLRHAQHHGLPLYRA